MRFSFLTLSATLLSATSASGSLIVHFDFNTKNSPFDSWHYQDLSGNGHHAHEVGSFYNLAGDTNAAADMYEDIGGERGGVYSYRWDFEADYDSDTVVDGTFTGGSGVWYNRPLRRTPA